MYPCQSRKERRPLAVNDPRSSRKCDPSLQLSSQIKAGEAKRASGSQREASEELAWADSWKQSAVCWLLASSFLEMAALANDYSFRQYSCLSVFSPKICSKRKDSNRPIQNKDPCQNSMLLTEVGREVYKRISSSRMATASP